MMGPQWLCDCNASGEGSTVAEAAKGGGQHFLAHTPGESSTSVGIYEKRGEWLWTISTAEQAEKAVYPMVQVAPTLTTLTASVISAAQTFQEFSLVMNSEGYVQTLDMPLPIDQRGWRGLVSGI